MVLGHGRLVVRLENKIMCEISTYNGGVRYGYNFILSSNYTFFSKMSVCKDFIEIKYPINNSIKIYINEIKIVFAMKFFFSKGIRIIHECNKYDPYLIFWTSQPREIILSLKDLGFPILE